MGSNPISTIISLTKRIHNNDNRGVVFCSSHKWGRMLWQRSVCCPLFPDVWMYLCEPSHGILKNFHHIQQIPSKLQTRILYQLSYQEACHLLVDISCPHNTLFTVTPSKCLQLSAEAPLRGEGFLTTFILPLEHWPLVMSKAMQGRGSQALLHVEIIWGGGKTISVWLPRRLNDKESACQCRRPRFHPWIGKIPWRRKWQPSLVLVPGKSHRRAWLARVHGVAKSQTQFSNWAHTPISRFSFNCSEVPPGHWDA